MSINPIQDPFGELLMQLSETAQYMWEKGWAERNAGNMSVNITGLDYSDQNGDIFEDRQLGPDELYQELAGFAFLITSTGSRMRNLAHLPKENTTIVRIADDGASYRMFPVGKSNSVISYPTSELSTHLGIHQLIAQRGSKEKVIIHTHATELIALTQNPELSSAEKINNLLWGMHPETVVFIPKGIGFVPYSVPGSDEIARLTIQNLENHDIVVWEKHGVFAIGGTISDTFDNIDILCKSAKIYFMCRGADFVPVGLSDSQLSELKKTAANFSSI